MGRVRDIESELILTPYLSSHGYPQTRLYKDGKGSTVRIHRLVAIAFVDNPEGKRCVGHIDSNRKNNNWENIRYATQAENNRNRSKRANATSIYYGVSWVAKSKKWKAQITINRTVVNLGSFIEEKEAAAVFNAAATERYGVFAKLSELT